MVYNGHQQKGIPGFKDFVFGVVQVTPSDTDVAHHDRSKAEPFQGIKDSFDSITEKQEEVNVTRQGFIQALFSADNPTFGIFFSKIVRFFKLFFVKYFKVIVKFFKVFVKFFKDFSPMLLHILYILQSCATQVTSICGKINRANVIHNT